MNKERLLYLIKRYRENQCTPTERNELYRLMSDSNIADDILELWDQLHSPTSTSLSGKEGEELFERVIANPLVQQGLQQTVRRKAAKLKYIAMAAAAVVIVCGTYTVLFLKSIESQHNYSLQQVDTVITPGSKKAQIIFEDGHSINLVGMASVDTIRSGHYLILNRGDEGVSYHSRKNTDDNSAETYNTLVTPLGGEYAVVLADGTKVWLNANSRLRYPTRFTSAQRTVELEGEAYFDVASLERKGKRVPFYVKTRAQTVEVLGTEFNINSFDENITTTLVEGQVALTYKGDGKQHILVPNDQIVYSERTHTHERKKIDPYYFAAWKDGNFAFEGTPLKSVMADIARWYNVEIHYEGDVSDVYFSGKISKLESIESLLQTIQWTGSVNFEIKGRRITIRK